MILVDMYNKYKLLSYFKEKLNDKGYYHKQISWIDGQIELLEKLIKIEGFNVIENYLRETEFSGDFNILLKVIQGAENIIFIKKYPEKWFLYVVKESDIKNAHKDNYIRLILDEYTNKNTLIFETEKSEIKNGNTIFVKYLIFFSQNKILNNGAKYINNKWQ